MRVTKVNSYLKQMPKLIIFAELPFGPRSVLSLPKATRVFDKILISLESRIYPRRGIYTWRFWKNHKTKKYEAMNGANTAFM